MILVVTFLVALSYILVCENDLKKQKLYIENCKYYSRSGIRIDPRNFEKYIVTEDSYYYELFCNRKKISSGDLVFVSPVKYYAVDISLSLFIEKGKFKVGALYQSYPYIPFYDADFIKGLNLPPLRSSEGLIIYNGSPKIVQKRNILGEVKYVFTKGNNTSLI